MSSEGDDGLQVTFNISLPPLHLSIGQMSSEGEDVVHGTPNISLPPLHLSIGQMSSEGENGQQGREIERRVEQNLETNNKNFFISSKSSNSEASPNLISHGHGQLNNPASNRDMKSLLKDLFKKFK